MCIFTLFSVCCCQDGAAEEGSNSAAAAALAAGTATAVPADEGAAASGEGGLPPFQDRLVEESGILGGQEIFLEDVRSSIYMLHRSLH